MTTGRVNFVCSQGSTFNPTITYKLKNQNYDPNIEEDEETNPKSVPVDLTGYSSRLQVREFHYSQNKIIDLSTINNGITLGGSAGTINLFLSASSSSLIEAGDFVYDLELESSNGTINRILEGNFTVTPEVTR